MISIALQTHCGVVERKRSSITTNCLRDAQIMSTIDAREVVKTTDENFTSHPVYRKRKGPFAIQLRCAK